MREYKEKYYIYKGRRYETLKEVSQVLQDEEKLIKHIEELNERDKRKG